MENKTGATDVAFEKMAQTMDFQMNRMREAGRNIQRSFGESLERLLTPVIGLFSKLTMGIERFIRSLPPGARDVIFGIVGALGALVGLAGGIMLLQGAMNLLGFSVFGLVKTFASLLLVGLPVMVLIGGASVAIFALYKAFQRNTGGISDAWFTSMEKIKLAWQGVVSLIRGEEFSKELTKELDRAENRGVLGFLNTVQRMMERFRVFWERLKEGFLAGVDALAESPAFQELVERFRGVFELFTGEGAQNSQEMLDRWGEAGESAGRKLATLGETAVRVLNWIMDTGAAVADALKDVSAKDIQQGIEGLVDTFKGLAEALSIVGSVLRTIANAITIVFKAIFALSDAYTTFIGTVTSHIFGPTEVAGRGVTAREMTLSEKLSRDFKRFGGGGEDDPFQGVREDLGDIARTWGSETRMGFEARDRDRKEDDNQERIVLLKEERTSLAVGRIREISTMINDAMANNRKMLQIIEGGGSTDEERMFAQKRHERLVAAIELMEKRRQDLKVFLNADDLRAASARAEAEDEARNLDKVEVASSF